MFAKVSGRRKGERFQSGGGEQSFQKLLITFNLLKKREMNVGREGKDEEMSPQDVLQHDNRDVL